MNCVETADNWMHTFDEDRSNDMGTRETQILPSFVGYTATKSDDVFKMPLVNGDIIPTPMCNNTLHPIDFTNTTIVKDSLVINMGAEDIMGGYHAGVLNSRTNLPITGKLTAFKIPRGGFDAASKRQPRQERKKSLSAEKIYENVMKNRQNAANNRRVQVEIKNVLKETVLSLQMDLIKSQKMLTQVSLSLHSEMKISADLRSEVKRLTV